MHICCFPIFTGGRGRQSNYFISLKNDDVTREQTMNRQDCLADKWAGFWLVQACMKKLITSRGLSPLLEKYSADHPYAFREEVVGCLLKCSTYCAGLYLIYHVTILPTLPLRP